MQAPSTLLRGVAKRMQLMLRYACMSHRTSHQHRVSPSIFAMSVVPLELVAGVRTCGQWFPPLHDALNSGRQSAYVRCSRIGLRSVGFAVLSNAQEQNREHAKRSRIRQKFLLECLQERLVGERRLNVALRQVSGSCALSCIDT